jgi:hypothetical protein
MYPTICKSKTGTSHIHHDQNLHRHETITDYALWGDPKREVFVIMDYPACDAFVMREGYPSQDENF